MQYKTLLVAEIPRIDCPTHGTRQMKVPWAGVRARFTALFECLVIEWLQHASIKAVAELLDMELGPGGGHHGARGGPGTRSP